MFTTEASNTEYFTTENENLQFDLLWGQGRNVFMQENSPHVADPIELFDILCESIESKIIIKCWLKAGILPDVHHSSLKSRLQKY